MCKNIMRFIYFCKAQSITCYRVYNLLMKRTITLITFLLAVCAAERVFAGGIWQKAVARPGTERTGHLPANTPTYRVDVAALKASLTASAKSADGRILELPMPDGTTRSFRVTQTSILPPALAAKYPEVQTFTGIAVDDEGVTAKLDYTVYGFHGMVYDGVNTSLIDPAGNPDDGFYTVHYKRDEIRNAGEGVGCETLKTNGKSPAAQAKTTDAQQRVLNGYVLRKYRLALSCTHQYAQKVTGSAAPSKAEVLSKMTTTMNRVNGVYERELSVTMVFVANEDAIIFPVATGDPIGDYNSSASSLLGENQKLCDTVIGSANYDIGHSFSTGAGGLSQVGVVCKIGMKAQSVTGSETPYGDGFDIDYVAHEMGHEFASDHTFNNSQSGACNANGVATTAFEPGSGSTIMAYAGICGPDNIQAHSDAYFHAASLSQIRAYIVNDGDACASKTPTGNKPPGVAAFGASYTIPARTPFELIAPDAFDSTGGSSITYCWEQWNLGEFGQTQANTKLRGPLFRSFSPVGTTVRTFPDMEMIRNGIISNASIDKASGEKLPDTGRFMTFKVGVRSVHNNYGCFTLPDDTIHIDVVRTGATGFTVTSQNTTGITYEGNSSQTVTWDIAGSNNAPINAAEVEIFMSADKGNTWTYSLGKFPNNGSASVTVPNPDTNITAARFKVKGAHNVFFNVNSKDFRVERNFESTVKLFPVPVAGTLHVSSENNGVVQAFITNMAGRIEWQGEINATLDLPVQYWASGVYILKMVDSSGRRTIRKFVIL